MSDELPQDHDPVDPVEVVDPVDPIDPLTSESVAEESTDEPTVAPLGVRLRELVLRPRIRVALVLLVVLAALGGADVLMGPARIGSGSRADVSRFVAPTATPSAMGSSTWFCPAGTADPVVSLANPDAEPARGLITFIADDGSQDVQSVEVPPAGRLELRHGEDITGAAVAALVELEHGGVVATQRLAESPTAALSPCASAASTTWYFADGATTLEAKDDLVLFNPFGEDALVDIQFATDRGPARPSALQGMAVPAGSVRVVDLTGQVRRRVSVAASITTRVGRLVAGRNLTFDGTTGPAGTSSMLAAPRRGTAWYFPDGLVSSDLDERYVVFNPSDRDVQAEVNVVVEGAEVEPFVLDVPAGDIAVLRPRDESRIPKDVGYSVVVATTSGDGVVVERRTDARTSSRLGLSSTLGGRVVTDRWVVADAAADDERDDHVVILDPTDQPASVTITAFGAGADGDGRLTVVSSLLVEAGGRLDVRLADFAVLRGALEITTDGAPVVVEHVTAAVAERSTPGVRPGYTIARATDGGFVAVPTTTITPTIPPTTTSTTTTTTTTTIAPTATTRRGATTTTTVVPPRRSTTTTTTTTTTTMPGPRLATDDRMALGTVRKASRGSSSVVAVAAPR